MRPRRTKAIVLGQKPISDWDKLVFLYTERFGRQDAKVTGGRKIQSKLSPHLEPFFLVDLMVAPGKRLDINSGAQVINSGRQIRSDPEKIKRAGLVTRLAIQVLKPGYPDQAIFDLLEKTLQLIAEGKLDPQFAQAIFTWQLTANLGYQPSLQPIKPGTAAYFSLASGRISQKPGRNQETYHRLDSKAGKLLKAMLEKDLLYLARLKKEKKVFSQAYQVIEGYAAYQLEIKAEIC